jgi:hypothetical protein
MNKLLLAGFVAHSATLLTAQPPPPPPLPLAASTVTGTISQLNYGPDGRVEGFVVTPNILVSLPPDWAIEVELLARTGNQVTAIGTFTPAPSGMQILEVQTLTVAGRTLTLAEPSPPVPYAASGIIRSLNYGRQGEVNGFVLENGILARTPPMGTSDVSVVKPGATISISGFARSTPGGRTVVEVQSITANGQTISMNAMPPAGPGPGRGPMGRRGPLAGPPPPPPPPGGPPPPPPDR